MFKPKSWIIFITVFLIACKTKNQVKGSFICLTDQVGRNGELTESTLKFAKLFIGKGPLYTELEFKGSNTVVIKAIGTEIATEYVIDQNYIRIKTDPSDLLLEIIDDRTLVGEGYAKGLYRKLDDADVGKCIAVSEITVYAELQGQSKLGTLPSGNSFIVLQKNPSWVKVESFGKIGFILSGDYFCVQKNNNSYTTNIQSIPSSNKNKRTLIDIFKPFLK